MSSSKQRRAKVTHVICFPMPVTKEEPINADRHVIFAINQISDLSFKTQQNPLCLSSHVFLQNIFQSDVGRIAARIFSEGPSVTNSSAFIKRSVYSPHPVRTQKWISIFLYNAFRTYSHKVGPRAEANFSSKDSVLGIHFQSPWNAL